MYDHTFLNLHQIRHQATHKVGCQRGDLHMVTLNLPRQNVHEGTRNG